MPSEWHARAGYLDATAWEIAPAQDETIQGIGPANGVNGEWADIAVPVHLAPREFRWKWYISDMFGLVVKFKNLYWNHEEDDWRTIKKINWVPLDNTQGMISEEIAYSIADKYPPRMTPLYESLGSGYALRFGARQNGTGVNNTGNGTLEIELVFKKYEPLRQYPFTYWLQNFNMNIVDGADEVADVKSTPQSPSYEYGNEKKPQYSKITNYLMSSYNNVSSFSQVYTDSDSQNELDTLSYTLPQSNGGSISYFSIEEKPE
jgi:hypothetical protein